ncbi:hypothetical protein V1512DRAFT_265228 [Lipomyces arxii]|uniref:uncharacterized protein n=1 Tax=Lipomyces arxii TaxID=56418 RepID=UPI0034CD70E7
MATNLDKSLDEIISTTPSTRRRSRGALRGARGVSGGGVRKSAPKARQARATPRVAAAAVASVVPSQLDVNDKIIISNLPLDVEENAIKDYFAVEIGPVRKCTLNYNAKGQSTGVVTMVFQKAGDAQRAWKRFNGTPIDGGKKVMHVELVVDPNKRSLASRIQPRTIAAPAPAQSNRGRKPTKTRGATAPRGGRDAARGGAPKRTKKTVEDLDAEMADYFVQKQ